jgi:phosphoenolpyruvate-protein kinase (PTS system EI component)
MLDGDNGEVIVDGGGDLSELIERSAPDQEPQVEHMRVSHRLPTTTRDGRSITLLCNVASEGDAVAGLANCAEGIGLLRTEFAFLRASSWPTRLQHEDALRSMFSVIGTRVATVRTLDFGYDKLPRFLMGTTDRGLALTLAHPKALCDQLRAILTVGARSRLRVLFPFVQNVDELQEARQLLTHVAHEIDRDGQPPVVGAMIESPEAVMMAEEIAGASDFLAIGTNDLAQHSLELHRRAPNTSVEAAADPIVLALVLKTVEAAHARGLRVEICGEAAGVPSLLSLFVGLGVDELSMAPDRLTLARDTVSSLIAIEAAIAARRALAASSVDQVLDIATGLLAPGQFCYDGDEVRDRVDRVLP